MFSSKKWSVGLLGLIMCLGMLTISEMDVSAGNRNYEAGTCITVTEDTNLFVEPHAELGIVAPLPKDAVVTVLENEELYCLVDYEGTQGYLYKEFMYYDAELAAEIAAKLEAERLARSEEIKMMAAMIQCEAGWEPYEGQVAVGAVIMNRVKSPLYPGTIQEVIYQPNQFSPSDSETFANLLATNEIRQSCRDAATEAYLGANNVGEALYFRRVGTKEGLVIGNHVFW